MNFLSGGSNLREPVRYDVLVKGTWRAEVRCGADELRKMLAMPGLTILTRDWVARCAAIRYSANVEYCNGEKSETALGEKHCIADSLSYKLGK